jgi:uracil phosphoribosyltransferase
MANAQDLLSGPDQGLGPDVAISDIVHLLPQTSQLRALHTVIRDKDARPADFTTYSRRIIRPLLETAIGLLPFERRDVTTPLGRTYRGLRLASELCGVSVVRAGESMEAELRELYPGAPIGKILIQRDRRTTMPHLYYSSLPADIAERSVLLMEPMLATGGSLLKAMDVLREADVRPENIVVVNLLVAPRAIAAIHSSYPHLKIVTSSIEDGLTENAFMVPGIGDFGDRYFGTEQRKPR